MVEDLSVPRISAKISSESVANVILRAINQRPAEIILPFNAWLLYTMNVFFPRLADWFVQFLRLQGWHKEERK